MTSVVAHIDPDEALAFLSELIDARSPNPPGDCREAALVCARWFGKAGIPVDIVESQSGFASAIATVRGVATGPTLVLNAHIDTVPVEDPGAWTSDPFKADFRDGKIFGRGAGDDKASVVAQALALMAIVRSGAWLGGTAVVTAVADEETGGVLGTRFLKETGLIKPDYLIVGEQTGNRVSIGERGINRLEITTHGRPAHGSVPWMGVSAITKAVRAVACLEDSLRPRLKERTDADLPPSSLNIGVIQGGVKPNVVPERCTFTVDRRIVPSETPDGCFLEITELLDSLFDGDEQPYSIKVIGRSAPYKTDPENPVVRSLIDAHAEVTGQRLPPVGYVHASDARIFANEAIPMAIFGPGDPFLAHRTNEYVGLDEVVEAARIYALSILKLIGENPIQL